MYFNGYPIQETDLLRFWKFVDKQGPEECWPWKGFTDTGGSYFSFHRRRVKATRFMYCISKGEDPGELNVCHECDNKGCVNPKHLWLGTQSQNMYDMILKRRANHAHGEAVHTAKLTEEQVVEIRGRKGHRIGASLAREYGMDPTTIRAIRNYETWRHVKGNVVQ